MAYMGQSQPSITYPTYSNFYTPTQVLENQSTNSSNGIIWVQGEAAARSYPILTRNTNILLMDSEKDVFYIKSTDSNGMPLPLRAFEYREKSLQDSVPEESKKESSTYVTKDEFEKRINEITNKLKKTENIKKEGKK